MTIQNNKASGNHCYDLIRQNQIHQAEQRLSKLLLDGLESGEAQLVDDNYWQQKRSVLRQRYQKTVN